jgi:AAA+ superfamily predicted ATPase
LFKIGKNVMVPVGTSILVEPKAFDSSLEHLLARLEQIDLRVQSAVHRARKAHLGDPDFQGLCISEEEVDRLLRKPCGLPLWAGRELISESTSISEPVSQTTASIAERQRESLRAGVRLRLAELAQLFRLDELDLDILLVCLAPEMDLRYEKLYAYLQDDVTRKRPSVDLILNLLCTTLASKLGARSRFLVGSRIFENQLLSIFVDPSQPEPPLLRKCCKLQERIVAFLLGDDELDEPLRAFASLEKPQTSIHSLLLPAALIERLLLTQNHCRSAGIRLIFYFHASRGTGKAVIAEALSREMGAPLLSVDIKQLLENPGLGFEIGVRLTLREARLQGALVYWKGFDLLLNSERACQLDFLLHRIQHGPDLQFLGGDSRWEPADSQVSTACFLRVELPSFDYANRFALWNRVLPTELRAEDVDLAILSDRFRLTVASIQAAAATANNLALWHHPKSGRVRMDDLYTACRLHSNRNLPGLARKVESRHTLDDIVLPPDQSSQLRELLDQVAFQQVVLQDWGFERKLSSGEGLNALFSGPPGTGKTMAAGAIANALHLDLYTIDLSQVVSKYIGETEKNLDQIFRAAQGSNAILFFDEADALFGKRSEVKDAHDRFANIEISYLLQKIDEYEGIAILATNLRQNLDDAFVRRMHFVIEFPLPDEEHRRRIWETSFPNQTPIAQDVDFAVLAREIRLAGGNIKNIGLAAAYSAAANGGVISMSHLMKAARREHQKLGRNWSEGKHSVRI